MIETRRDRGAGSFWCQRGWVVQDPESLWNLGYRHLGGTWPVVDATTSAYSMIETWRNRGDDGSGAKLVRWFKTSKIYEILVTGISAAQDVLSTLLLVHTV